MRKPRALRRGDRIAVVAPASPFPLQTAREEFERGIAELGRLGFVPVYDEQVFARDGYLAGSATIRAAALRSALTDPSIAGIIGIRGGYGSAQTLPLLDAEEVRRAAKPVIGYSDLTALLSYVTTICHVVSFHGPMLDQRLSRGSAGYDERSFLGAIGVAEPLGDLRIPGLECLRSGEAAGILVGGTLTQLVASLGTPFAFDPPPGHVLFLDEVSERPYRIDRMVTQLAQSGRLARASAVVIGELPGCDEPSGEVTARSVLIRLFADFPGPVIVGFPSGHTAGPSVTLPFGVRARVVAAQSSRLVIEESAVE